MNINEWLSAQKKLLEDATPGPWQHIPGDSYCAYPSVVCGKKTLIFEDHEGHDIAANSRCCEDGYPPDETDAAFIASVRTEHARALKIIEKLREEMNSCIKTVMPYASAEPEESDDISDIMYLKIMNALAYFPDDSEVGSET